MRLDSLVGIAPRLSCVINRYSYDGEGAFQTWIGSHRLVVLDASAGPVGQHYFFRLHGYSVCIVMHIYIDMDMCMDIDYRHAFGHACRCVMGMSIHMSTHMSTHVHTSTHMSI